jgi:hypothetical protein
MSKTTDEKIQEVEDKLSKKPEASDANKDNSTSPSICGESQSLDDMLAAMGIIKKK